MTFCLTVRSERDSAFRIGWLSNKPLIAAVGLTFLLQLAAIYAPFLQPFFDTVSLSARQLLICAALSTVVFWCYELEKWLIRRRPKK
jgi:Ca2+-transporting ATPase